MNSPMADQCEADDQKEQVTNYRKEMFGGFATQYATTRLAPESNLMRPSTVAKAKARNRPREDQSNNPTKHQPNAILK